jgi:hypothetical protein
VLAEDDPRVPRVAVAELRRAHDHIAEPVGVQVPGRGHRLPDLVPRDPIDEEVRFRSGDRSGQRAEEDVGASGADPAGAGVPGPHHDVAEAVAVHVARGRDGDAEDVLRRLTQQDGVGVGSGERAAQGTIEDVGLAGAVDEDLLGTHDQVR